MITYGFYVKTDALPLAVFFIRSPNEMMVSELRKNAEAFVSKNRKYNFCCFKVNANYGRGFIKNWVDIGRIWVF